LASSQDICSGGTTNIGITNPSNVSGTTFSWSIGTITGTVAGQFPGSGTVISQTLTSAVGGTVDYIITAYINGCPGASTTVTVTVDPIPVGNSVASGTHVICSGTSLNITPTLSIGTGTFAWTGSNGSGGTGNITDSPVNTTNNPIDITYTVIPTGPAPTSCVGSPFTIVVTVNPNPGFTATNNAPAICNGASTNILLNSSTTGHQINVVSVNYNGAGNSGTIIPGTTTFTDGNTLTEVLTNATNAPIDVVYTFNVTTPSTTPECPLVPVNQTVTVRVYPVPDVQVSPQTICSGALVNVPITSNVSGTTFTWSISTDNVSGASAGSGSTISQVLSSFDGINSGSVTYTITPVANGCFGTPVDVIITVNPIPVMTNLATTLAQQICSEEALNFIPTSTIGAATLSWTATYTSEISAASVTSSGSGPITDAPINISNVAGTITYEITPSLNSCIGLPINLVVLVKPKPSAFASNTVICSGQNAVINIFPTPQNVSGTTFSWTATSPSGNVSGFSDGDGSVINQVLSTNDQFVGTVVYSITPWASNCEGPVTNVTVTVNPVATVIAEADFAVCEPSSFVVTGTIGGSATLGTWSIVSGAGSISASLTSGNIVTATYTVGVGDIAGSVVLRLTTDDPDGVGPGGPCSFVSDDVTINVNRQARVTAPADFSVCEPSSITLTGTLSGSASSGSWSLINGNGALQVSSVTGLSVSAIYTPDITDVGTVLRFRLTTNDPDGFGPCSQEFDEVDITINESAKVNAGADFAVCEDEVVNLNGSFSGSTSSVSWSGASGAFNDPADPLTFYTLTAADITAGQIVLTLTTNDPPGVCPLASDAVIVKINKLPNVFISGLEPSYAENSPVDFLDGFPLGGTFTGPGIFAGTNQFHPNTAGVGFKTITYTYTDPLTGCDNFTTRSTIVNPVTSIEFYVKEENRLDVNGFPVICANQGLLTLVGLPPVNDPNSRNPTLFISPDPILSARLIFDGTDWKINTDGLPPATYIIQYVYTNQFFATDTLTKDLTVFQAPLAIIDVGNNCFENAVLFEESSTPSASIDTWIWTYGEGTNGSTGSVAEPTYQYLSPGPKTVSLEVITNNQCRNKAFKDIIIGTLPKPDFTRSSFCQGDVTSFFDNSTVSEGTINGYLWDFDDAGVTSSLKDPQHTFSSYGIYNVNLRVFTNAGCSKDTTKTIFILDTPPAVTANPYREDFNASQGTWVSVIDYALQGTASSWEWKAPDGSVITASTKGWWTGANSKSYFNSEKSFVIGPCLDVSALERPMFSMNYWVDTQAGFDGGVVQYSTDGGTSWVYLGDAENRGINWYNTRDVVGRPGGLNNYAWTGSSDGWKTARFNLDQIPQEVRDNVIFRIAFGSNSDNPSGATLNGFAFDDIYIGEKQRMVMVENFANYNDPESNTATSQLATLLASQVTTLPTGPGKTKSDFFKVEYHLAVPGADAVNLANPTDPSARAFYYGIAKPPSTLMDGIIGDYYGRVFNGGISNIDPIQLDRRALEDPAFRIDIDTTQTTTRTDVLDLNVTYTYTNQTPFTGPVTFQVALIETDVVADVFTLTNVLRRHLLTTGGQTENRSWALNDQLAIPISKEIDVQLQNQNNLWVVAYAQDKFSQEILQATLVKAPRKNSATVVGVEDDPTKAELNAIRVYPNPVSQKLYMQLDEKLTKGYTWQIVDQRGVIVLSGDVDRDLTTPQQVLVGDLPNGIYFLELGIPGKSKIYKKIAVMNSN
ncbi:MAG: PKD domain-containing protein, partial [Cyclobacteriaceae bacterium]|nr:PKD domain-containing protein [Cyclobacteriaceae bacterium]